MKTKKCNGELCEGKQRPLSEFNKHSGHKDGLCSYCKLCHKLLSKKYADENKEKVAKYQKDYRIQNEKELKKYKKEYRNKSGNQKKAKEYQIQYQIENKEELNKKQKERYDENKEEILKQQQEFYQKNKEKIKARVKKYSKENRTSINRFRNKKLKLDINYRILHNLRGRLHSALNGKSKIKRTLELLSCTIDEFKNHLQSQFTKGMSWDNYGLWHIDHIRPCASFDLSKKLEQLECFNFKNLQPLWALDNLKKGSFYVSQKS